MLTWLTGVLANHSHLSTILPFPSSTVKNIHSRVLNEGVFTLETWWSDSEALVRTSLASVLWRNDAVCCGDAARQDKQTNTTRINLLHFSIFHRKKLQPPHLMTSLMYRWAVRCVYFTCTSCQNDALWRSYCDICNSNSRRKNMQNAEVLQREEQKYVHL